MTLGPSFFLMGDGVLNVQWMGTSPLHSPKVSAHKTLGPVCIARSGEGSHGKSLSGQQLSYPVDVGQDILGWGRTVSCNNRRSIGDRG